MRSVCVSLAALLAAAACDRGPTQLGDQAADEVAPKEVPVAELRAIVSDPRVKRFYAARQWEAAWNEDRARALTEALRDAPHHGLEAVKFLKQGDAATDPVRREASLSLAAISFAGALANGQADPRKIFEIYSVPGARIDVAAGLNQAIESGNVAGWLAGLAPQDAEYRALSEAFVRFSQAAKDQSAAIPEGKIIKPGARDKRMSQIVGALRRNGYLTGDLPVANPDMYSEAIAHAVRRLQKDYGEDQDGVIGKVTLTMLNTGAADRARTLAINLERRRWLERDPPATRIDVNTAAAFLAYWRDGRMIDARRVVVGQPDWETPQLGSPIVRLVANPPWNVPESIEQDELAAKGEAYLARNNFIRKDGRLVQQPGPDAALGLVKFDMDNPYAIYLHDTPAKALFATNDRHSSHGCVRVHNAVQFARLLAQHDGQLDRFDKALASGKENSVDLKTRIPVRLLYHTAYVDKGRVLFRTDPYGWDDALARALGLPVGTNARRARTHVSISGP